MSFKVVKNNLDRDSLFKSLVLENERYVIKFMYEGDYEQDIANNTTISHDRVTMICKPKADALPLNLMAGHVTTDIPYATVMTVENIVGLRQLLDDVIDDMKELETIVKQTFKLEPM